MNIQTMAGHHIRRLHQISTQRFAQRLKAEGHDLTPVQFAAMDAIHAAPGIDQASVAARIAYDRATIGGVIDRLERKGLVARHVSERDKRARVLELSPKGAALYQELLPVVQDLQGDILSRLGPGERRRFLELLTKVTSDSQAS